MKLNFSPCRAHTGAELQTRRSRGFTMVEIALCLAIIAFALVAIIGVLPSGLSVQKDNREQTIINLDSAFLMDALLSGTVGQDDLTNYVQGITVVSTLYSSGGIIVPGTTTATDYTNGGNVNNWKYTNAVFVPWTGSTIVGLLSTPKYVPVDHDPRTIGWGYSSNTVTAVMRAINGPAVDQGVNGTTFAFYYQVQVEVVPSAEYAYLWGSAGTFKHNVTAPGLLSSIAGPLPADAQTAVALQNNLNEIRLSYKWPLLPGAGNRFGGGRQVYRTSVAGAMMVTNAPAGPDLYFIQPLTYQSTP